MPKPSAAPAAPKKNDTQRRGRRAVDLVLRTGAVAAALGSILALVFTVGHLFGGGGGGKSAARASGAVDPFKGLVLGVPRNGVHRLTVADFLAWRGYGRSAAKPGDEEKRGVAVQYRLLAPHYHSGEPFFLTFRLVRVGGGTETPLVTREDSPVAEINGDHCDCKSPFLLLPRGRGTFRVDVAIYRTPARVGGAVEEAHSPLFSVS